MLIGCVRAHPKHTSCKSARVQSLGQGTPHPAPAQREAGSVPVVARSSRTGGSQGVTPGAPSPNMEVGEDPKVGFPPLPVREILLAVSAKFPL